MSEIIIRPMEVADLSQVEEIDRLSFTSPWHKGAFLTELQASPSLCWVAEISETHQVAGVIIGWLIEDELQVATLSVHPEWRKLGIGRRLLAQLLQDSQPKGAKVAFLEVAASNQAAQNLYRSFGFKVQGRRKNYYAAEKDDALLMVLERVEVLEVNGG